MDEALGNPKGKALNSLADQYFSRGVVEGDYEQQLKELKYLQDMANSGEVRLAFNEWGSLYAMIHACEVALGIVIGNRETFRIAVNKTTRL